MNPVPESELDQQAQFQSGVPGETRAEDAVQARLAQAERRRAERALASEEQAEHRAREASEAIHEPRQRHQWGRPRM